jgi:hypothetical protein
MSESWQKRLLIAAAAWNILGGIGALLDPAAHFALADRWISPIRSRRPSSGASGSR